MHDNTERSKNVIMAAVPPSSNAMNECTFADIVVNLKTSSASYSSRSLARSLGTRLCSMSNYSRTTASLECTALTRAREPQRQLSKQDDGESGYPVEMSMQPQCSQIGRPPQYEGTEYRFYSPFHSKNSNLQKSKLATFSASSPTSRGI